MSSFATSEPALLHTHTHQFHMSFDIIRTFKGKFWRIHVTLIHIESLDLTSLLQIQVKGSGMKIIIDQGYIGLCFRSHTRGGDSLR